MIQLNLQHLSDVAILQRSHFQQYCSNILLIIYVFKTLPFKSVTDREIDQATNKISQNFGLPWRCAKTEPHQHDE